MGDKEVGYVPHPDFKEDTQEPLFDIQLDNNTELWLLQLPDDHFPDFEEQELSLDLGQDGELGSLKGPNGRTYTLVNFPSGVAETTVFQSSPSGTRIAGKISRHVSLVHYPEADDFEAQEFEIKKQMSVGSRTTFTKSHFSTPSQSRGRSTHSGRKSSFSGVSKMSKGGVGESSRHTGHSTQDSGRGHSSITVSGSSEQSHRKKSKTKT